MSTSMTDMVVASVHWTLSKLPIPRRVHRLPHCFPRAIEVVKRVNLVCQGHNETCDYGTDRMPVVYGVCRRLLYLTKTKLRKVHIRTV